jgi:hypothetical protein
MVKPNKQTKKKKLVQESRNEVNWKKERMKDERINVEKFKTNIPFARLKHTPPIPCTLLFF